jgi:hypothetical protein
MRTFKLAGALVVALALSALAVATASAAETLWRWLPGSVGETFKGAQIGTATLTSEAGFAFSCTKGSILLEGSELTGTAGEKFATLALATLHLEGCTSATFAINSLGDKPGFVLMHIELHNCVINKANNEFGLLVLPLETHLEIPLLSLLVLILPKGLLIARIVTEDETKHDFLITAKAKEAGKAQDPEKCEGGEKEILKIKIDAKPEEKATLASQFLIEFDLTKDKTGEEIMV